MDEDEVVETQFIKIEVDICEIGSSKECTEENIQKILSESWSFRFSIAYQDLVVNSIFDDPVINTRKSVAFPLIAD